MNPSNSSNSEYPTPGTVNLYSDVLVAVRVALDNAVDPAPNTLHTVPVGLSTGPVGLSTGPLPFPGGEDEALELWLDLQLHKLVIATSYGTRFESTLIGHSARSFTDTVLDALAVLGVIVEIDVASINESYGVE
ncbi:MAG: hypothetical protein GY759_09495 [Chloroflexi bacterium]|nr:hypothetical protein [Chloroflexota bacterium]